MRVGVLPLVCTSWLQLSSDSGQSFPVSHHGDTPAVSMWPPAPRHNHFLAESLFLEALPSVLRASCHSFSSYCCSHTHLTHSSSPSLQKKQSLFWATHTPPPSFPILSLLIFTVAPSSIPEDFGPKGKISMFLCKRRSTLY